MKKLCLSIFAAAISFVEICGFAEPASGTAGSIGRIELVDYILIAGAALFLLGMLFILLSMYAGTDKKTTDIEIDSIEEYDDFDEEEQTLEDGEAEELSESAETEDAAEEVVETVETDEVEDAADETEQTVEPEQEEAEEPIGEEEEVQEDNEPEIIAEPESEPEPELPKVRITLTGLNNFDVKIMEFTDKATLGRRSGNDIMISDNAVSGSHCEFTVEEEKIYIADLNSTNGTMLNDEPIVKTEINSGDVLIIGKCKYRVNISK